MLNTETVFRTVDKSANLADNYVNPYYLPDRKLRVAVARVAVARVAGRLYAFDALCTHERCQLTAGMLSGTTLMCPCDASRFDVTSGAVLNGPAREPLAIFEVREADGEIQVRV